MPDLIPNESYELQKEQFNDSLAQVATATMMAQSLSMCLERKHLIGIEKSEFFELAKRSDANRFLAKTKWIKINQIGRPVNDNLNGCFEAMQNILQSCAIPQTKLLFLITGNGKVFNLFMGTQSDDVDVLDAFQSDINNFVNISWTGVSCKAVKENGNDYEEIKSFLDEKYSTIHAVTGIPTQNLQSGYPGTVEYLMGGLRHGKMAYLVVAEPVKEQEIDNIIYSCNEMQGQADSMKSFTFADSMQRGHNDSISKAHGITCSESDAIGTNQKDPQAIGKSLLLGGGIIAAGLAFPAITPFVNVLDFLAAPVSNGGLGGISVLSAMIPQKTRTHTVTNGTSDTTTETHGTSESYSKSITKNLVNAHISHIVDHLKKQCARYEEGKAIGMWNVGCYLFSNAGNATSPLQLKSLLSGKDSIYEPIRIHNISSFCEKAGRHDYHGFINAPYLETHIKTPTTEKTETIERQNTAGRIPQIFNHPFGTKFNGLTTMLTTKELTCLANFPLHSVPGINVVEVSPSFSLSEQKLDNNKKCLNIGKLLWSGSSTDIHVNLPLDTLSRHAMVCGVNGSGKTNTVLSILDGFMKADRPFFVIEPAKTEYVDWALKYNANIEDPKKKIKIFIPGCSNYSKAKSLANVEDYKNGFKPDVLRINPFEVIQLENSEMRVLSHIDRLKASFASAFPMQDILPVIMEHLLYKLYTGECPLLGENEKLIERNKKNKWFPSLKLINDDFIKDLMDEIGYARENTQNISAALRTRFRSLTYGWKNELLNNSNLVGMTWDELFGSPVIVNLSYAGDDQDRAFIMSLLLQFLYEYRIAEAEAGKLSFDANECRHLVVVEEAHRVMGRNDNPESPQHKSGLMFSNFLSEVRAYGQGMMVVDQVPTRLIEDAIKNTNVKIIHKLVASDDSQRVAECIGLTPEQQKVIAKLSIGQAVLAGFNSADVMSANSSDIYLAQINKMK